MSNPRWRRDGQEPDYRFTLANERTFLAWVRTALALLAFGVLLVQFATRLHPPAGVVALGAGLAAFSGLLGWLAYRRWRGNEVAMRQAQPLPAPVLLPLTAAVLALVAAALAAMIVRG